MAQTVGRALGDSAAPLSAATKPFADCAASLRAAKWDYLAAAIALYRKKAGIRGRRGGRQLDDIEDPRAKGYMTCRVAICGKLDHEMTPEETQPGNPGGRAAAASGFFPTGGGRWEWIERSKPAEMRG